VLIWRMGSTLESKTEGSLSNLSRGGEGSASQRPSYSALSYLGIRLPEVVVRTFTLRREER